MHQKWSLALSVLCVFLLTGCPSKPSGKRESGAGRPLVERVFRAHVPAFKDDEPVASLRSAVRESLSWFETFPESTQLSLGGLSIPARVMRESLEHFAYLADSGQIDDERLFSDFDIFRVVPEESNRMLVTGYYEPVLEGSLDPDGDFRAPVYPVPSDLISVELKNFDPDKFRSERIVGRVEKNRLVPYYSRSEIDGQKVLEKNRPQSTAPLVWLKDPVDCFFLHVQGSGLIKIRPDGAMMRLGYAGANGRPYRSIGKDLIERGAVSHDEMSMQAIRNYLHAHPESRDEIMWKNESYVFFKWVSRGPMGSLGVVLTSGRSIAADPHFHPRGSLAFLVSEKPLFDSSGKVMRWERFSRWVLNQDAGGAIKGAGRIDLFCGTGDAAEMTAGPMKQQGDVYYLIKKGLIPPESLQVTPNRQ